ncbi:hypothetical protein ACLOJK_028804 [Asimina triloba]
MASLLLCAQPSSLSPDTPNCLMWVTDHRWGRLLPFDGDHCQNGGFGEMKDEHCHWWVFHCLRFAMLTIACSAMADSPSPDLEVSASSPSMKRKQRWVHRFKGKTTICDQLFVANLLNGSDWPIGARRRSVLQTLHRQYACHRMNGVGRFRRFKLPVALLPWTPEMEKTLDSIVVTARTVQIRPKTIITGAMGISLTSLSF